jgi:hypothetical protein
VTTLDFGQPAGGIIQTAYVVDDVGAAIERWIRDLRVGPWFLLERFTGDDPEYRGGPSRTAVAIAMAFAGHMQVELIQPLDDEPSVYRETIDATGYGFHHWGIGSADFAGDIARHEARGHEVAFRAGVPTGGSVAYVDTHGELPGFVELIELGDEMERTFTRFYAASLAWDGADPVRPFA